MSKDIVKDASYSIAKGIVGMLPGGGVLSEIFGLVIVNPADKRRERELLAIAERLERLEKEGIDIEALSKNEEFLTIALQVYGIAIKTHQNEKRVALLNTITNTPKSTLDENEKIMFLNYIDEFNEWHLRILRYFHKPGELITATYRVNDLIQAEHIPVPKEFPDLFNRPEFYVQIRKDLIDRGLIVDLLPYAGENITTQLGDRFIEFIK